jgi:OOP family OmpA-OmpF porin
MTTRNTLEDPPEKAAMQPSHESTLSQDEEAPLEEIPSREPAPGRYKYCLTLHIKFDIDSADIRPEYHDELARVGNFMNRYDTTTAVIEGHTDNIGIYEHNMELSRRRAESVVNYLTENFGIARSRLNARGYGSSRPVADNATDEGRQKNRRIEAIIDCAFDVTPLKPPDYLSMQLRIEFESGKADILPRYRSGIITVGELMKRYPETTALIEGHTDNIGGYEYNMKLSQERAESVVNFITENFGIERFRLTAKGFGETHRVAYNNTPEGRRMNRRINATIFFQGKREQ